MSRRLSRTALARKHSSGSDDSLTKGRITGPDPAQAFNAFSMDSSLGHVCGTGKYTSRHGRRKSGREVVRVGKIPSRPGAGEDCNQLTYSAAIPEAPRI